MKKRTIIIMDSNFPRERTTFLSIKRLENLKEATTTIASKAVPDVSAAAINSNGLIGEWRISLAPTRPNISPVKL